jgi:DNA polymerase-3 subunit delta
MTGLIPEIEKIAAYNPGAKEITAETIRKVSSKNVNEDIFALTDCMLAGDLKGALSQLDRLIYNKATAQQVIAQTASAMKRVAICAYMTQNGHSQADIAKKWGYHPYAVKKAVEAGKRFSLKDALSALSVLDDADVRIKRGESDPLTELAVMTQTITAKLFKSQPAGRSLF